MTFFDLDAAIKEKFGDRPQIKVGGQTFTFRSRLPWAKYDQFILALETGIYPDGKNSLDLTREFFSVCLIKADRQRFLELLDNGTGDDEDDDGDDIVDPVQMRQLISRMLKYYQGVKDEPEPALPVSPNGHKEPTVQMKFEAIP